ncbi:MAG: hypothetical protein QMD07_03380 [Thermodesulfovibrionales bacterium]|nr:hypothetical protein [Thermodesulfovibrionales bacterium]
MSRNTVKKALVVIVCLAAAIIVTKLYLKTIGILIVAAVVIYALLSLTKLSKEEKKASLETAGNSDKMPLGKAVQFLQYLIYGLIVIAVIKWFIGQSK